MAKFQIQWNWTKIRRELMDYLGITIGVSITALALVWLLIPNKIAAGGVSGLATVCYYLWKWPVSVTLIVLNIPLFLSCLWVFGPRFGVKTLFGTVLLSIMVQFWESVINLVPFTADTQLASIFGGLIAGTGMGIAFRFRGTTGGTDQAARLFNHFTGVSVGQSLLLFDGMVIIFAGLAFHSVEKALWAIIAMFVTGKTLDMVLEGLDYAKAAIVISDNSAKIGPKLLQDLNRGATGLLGRGLYSTEQKEVILCVISRAEVTKLKQIVHSVDPKAFVIITDVHEVLGEGFKE